MLRVCQKIATLVWSTGNQTEAGKILGLSQNTVSQLCRGIPLDLSISTCRKIVLATAGRPEDEQITLDDCCELADHLLERQGTTGAGPPGPRATTGGRAALRRGGKGAA